MAHKRQRDNAAVDVDRGYRLAFTGADLEARSCRLMLRPIYSDKCNGLLPNGPPTGCSVR